MAPLRQDTIPVHHRGHQNHSRRSIGEALVCVTFVCSLNQNDMTVFQ